MVTNKEKLITVNFILILI